MKPTAATISQETLDVLTKLETSLNGIMDRCPEAFKGTLSPIKAEFDAALSKMKPTDAALCAADIAFSLNSAAILFDRLQEAMNGLVSQAASINDAVNAKVTTALCEKVKEDVDAKITAGDLVPKAVSDLAIANAIKLGRETALNELKTSTARREQLVAAKIPLPVDDSVLAGTDDEFSAVLKRGTERLTSLNEKGVTDALVVSELVWSPTFERDMKLLTSLNAAVQKGNPFKPAVTPEKNASENQPARRFVG